MPRSNPAHRPRRQKAIRSRLMRGIIVIILLTVLIPIIAYNNLPEWVYYLTPATRLWIATEEINSAYHEGVMNDVLREIDKKYDVTVEIRLADGRFIYSTAALVDELSDGFRRMTPLYRYIRSVPPEADEDRTVERDAKRLLDGIPVD